MNRDEAISRIKAGLKKRSGNKWSVTGGRGTAWGWIKIDAKPARCTAHHIQRPNTAGNPGDFDDVNTGWPSGHMTPADRAELAKLLGLEKVHFQGVSIPASNDYYQEHVDRAEGRPPSVIGTQYWD